MPLSSLHRRVERGELKEDAGQREAAAKLQRLADELRDYTPRTRDGGGLIRFFARARTQEPKPRGLYIHGGVGTGKSMLMDLFYRAVDVEKKRRAHFHEFMQGVHTRLHVLRQVETRDDPLGRLGGELADASWLLCFDEFHVVNIADAMILSRLFGAFFDAGGIIVATSNWPPRRLYENGLNRERFLPFIDLLLEQVEVVEVDGPIDYRLDRLQEIPVFLSPDDDEARRNIEQLIDIQTDGAPTRPAKIEVGSRTLEIPRASNKVAVLSFEELCGRPLAARDYMALAERYPTIVLTGIPLLTAQRRDEARRLMTLVDVLYERGTMLIASAAGEPDELYRMDEGGFEFQRTLSRLEEMRSSDYLKRTRQARPIDLGRVAEVAGGDTA